MNYGTSKKKRKKKRRTKIARSVRDQEKKKGTTALNQAKGGTIKTERENMENGQGSEK